MPNDSDTSDSDAVRKPTQTSNACAREEKVTRRPDWAGVYLALLGKTGKRMESAKRAGVDYSTVCRRRKDDPNFEAMESDAIGVSIAMAEDELYRRAVEGTEHTTFDAKGNVKGVRREFSDILLLRFLERHDPRWRQKQAVDVTTTKVNPIYGTRAERLAALEKAREEIRQPLG